jgi:hypothetical protein
LAQRKDEAALDESEQTFEGEYLKGHTDVRKKVTGSKGFREWKKQLPTIVVDGVKYYIRGGDMLKDEDQIIVEWARKSGLITD